MSRPLCAPSTGARDDSVTVYRDGSEIRIERSEEKVRIAVGGSLLLGVGIAVAGTFVADTTTDWLIVVGFLALGLYLAQYNLRHREICVIRPDQVGHGYVNGRMWWIDRGPLASVQVTHLYLLQVGFFDAHGKTRESFTLTNFDPDELREAFKEAGFQVR